MVQRSPEDVTLLTLREEKKDKSAKPSESMPSFEEAAKERMMQGISEEDDESEKETAGEGVRSGDGCEDESTRSGANDSHPDTTVQVS